MSASNDSVGKNFNGVAEGVARRVNDIDRVGDGNTWGVEEDDSTSLGSFSAGDFKEVC